MAVAVPDPSLLRFLPVLLCCSAECDSFLQLSGLGEGEYDNRSLFSQPFGNICGNLHNLLQRRPCLRGRIS